MSTHAIPADLHIPCPPRPRSLPIIPGEPWWREAMRWSLIALSAGVVAGEVSLRLFGP